MDSYTSYLGKMAFEHKSLLCFGLDPDLERIPATIDGNAQEKIITFYTSIIDALPNGEGVAALKPNYAWFAQYGFEGLRALKLLIEKYREKFTIIFDGKRGDIGTSSTAYAKEAFDFWQAHALTISPYMGHDSIAPFLKRCEEGRGAYMLCRTSNSGAKDFQSQDLSSTNKPLFIEVAKKSVQWHTDGLGLVVGATNATELEQIYWKIEPSGKPIPFLIPGVGAQGGSAKEVTQVLRTISSQYLPLHRINASSSIAYAWQKKQTSDYIGAALSAINEFNLQINFKP